MEIFGCNNLVSYKVATRLKIPWICNIFYLIATLLTGCKHLVTTGLYNTWTLDWTGPWIGLWTGPWIHSSLDSDQSISL